MPGSLGVVETSSELSAYEALKTSSKFTQPLEKLHGAMLRRHRQLEQFALMAFHRLSLAAVLWHHLAIVFICGMNLSIPLQMWIIVLLVSFEMISSRVRPVLTTLMYGTIMGLMITLAALVFDTEGSAILIHLWGWMPTTQALQSGISHALSFLIIMIVALSQTRNAHSLGSPKAMQHWMPQFSIVLSLCMTMIPDLARQVMSLRFLVKRYQACRVDTATQYSGGWHRDNSRCILVRALMYTVLVESIQCASTRAGALTRVVSTSSSDMRLRHRPPQSLDMLQPPGRQSAAMRWTNANRVRSERSRRFVAVSGMLFLLLMVQLWNESFRESVFSVTLLVALPYLFAMEELIWSKLHA